MNVDRLAPGGSVVEYTGGSTGVSLSLVCAANGYPLRIVTSDAFSREKLGHMEMLGARLEIVPSDGGRMTEALTRQMIETARQLAGEPGTYWTDQLDNADQLGSGATIVTLMCDSGIKYLSTELYREHLRATAGA